MGFRLPFFNAAVFWWIRLCYETNAHLHLWKDALKRSNYSWFVSCVGCFVLALFFPVFEKCRSLSISQWPYSNISFWCVCLHFCGVNTQFLVFFFFSISSIFFILFFTWFLCAYLGVLELCARCARSNEASHRKGTDVLYKCLLCVA